MINQWEKIARSITGIQDTKNTILNDNLLAIIKKYSSKGKAFDYGCGWGEFADMLARSGYEVEAFDESDQMVARAKEKFNKPKFLTKTEFWGQLNTYHKKFNLVVSNLVICILDQKQQKKMIEDIKAIVKDDGLIVLSFCHPCLDYLTESVLAKRIRPYEFNVKYDKEFKYRKIIHENHIEFDDYHRPLEYYTSLFVDNGLEIIDIDESDVLKTEYYPDFIIFALKLATKEN